MTRVNARKTENFEVERIVGFVTYPSQALLLEESTRGWSSADFDYALERLEIQQTDPEKRNYLRPMYQEMRAKLAENTRLANEAAADRRNEELARAIREGKMLEFTNSAENQTAALGLHKLIVLVLGFLGFGCIAGGIIAIIYSAQSQSEFELLGAHLKTGSVGVAFVGIGLVVVLYAVKWVLKNQHDLARIPSQKELPSSQPAPSSLAAKVKDDGNNVTVATNTVAPVAAGSNSVAIGTVNIHGGDLTIGQQLKPRGSTPEEWSAFMREETAKLQSDHAPNLPQLSPEARMLLKAACKDPAGFILHHYPIGSMAVRTNGTNFAQGGDARRFAVLEAALNELRREVLVEYRAGGTDRLYVTKRGFEVADFL